MKSKLLDEIISSKFSDLIFQPTQNLISPTNMYVINFVKEKKLYSLHVSCFLRIVLDNQILLTSTDECFDINYNPISKYSEKDSLVNYNISCVKQLALNSTISTITISKCGDLVITLSNNIAIEVIPDCLMNSFEYYRLFEYNNFNNKIVVSFMDKSICIE